MLAPSRESTAIQIADAVATDEGQREHAPPPPPQHEQQQQRPHQVELLLDRDRPGVQQRRLRAEVVEVALPRHDEAPVGRVSQRRERVAPQRSPRGRGGHVGGPGDHRRQQDRHRGQQPAGAATPEAEQADPPGPAELGQQQAGDQEPGQHEEDVDPEQPAGQPADPRVIAHDRQHGQRPDPVESGNVLEPAPSLAHGGTGARATRAMGSGVTVLNLQIGSGVSGGVRARGDRLPPGLGSGVSAARTACRSLPPYRRYRRRVVHSGS